MNLLLVVPVNNMVLSCTLLALMVFSTSVVAFVSLNVLKVTEMMVFSALNPLLMVEVLVLLGILVMVSVFKEPKTDVAMTILKAVNNTV